MPEAATALSSLRSAVRTGEMPGGVLLDAYQDDAGLTLEQACEDMKRRNGWAWSLDFEKDWVLGLEQRPGDYRMAVVILLWQRQKRLWKVLLYDPDNPMTVLRSEEQGKTCPSHEAAQRAAELRLLEHGY